MRIIAYIAMSVDGYIADGRGSEDFLSDLHWDEFVTLIEEHGAYVMGRKAYDAVRSWGGQYADDLKKTSGIVLSRTPGDDRAASPEEALAKLKSLGKTRAIIAGGAETYSSFLERGLLHGIIFSVEPKLLGSGLRPFKTGINRPLMLASARPDSASGIVRLEYELV